MVGKGKQGVKRMCGSDFGSLRRIRPLRAHVLFTCSAAIKQDDNLPRENDLQSVKDSRGILASYTISTTCHISVANSRPKLQPLKLYPDVPFV